MAGIEGSFFDKISKSRHVLGEVVLLFDTESCPDFLAAHRPPSLENGGPVDFDECAPVLLDEVVLLEPPALLAGLLLLEVERSDVDLALDLGRMLFPPLLEAQLAGRPCALQRHSLRGSDLEDLCLLGRLQCHFLIGNHRSSSSSSVQPPSSAAIRLGQHFLRHFECSPRPPRVVDDASGPADLLVGLFHTRLSLVSDLAPPHGGFGGKSVLELYGMDEEVFSLGRVEVEVDGGEGLLGELNYSLIAEVESVSVGNSGHAILLLYSHALQVVM